MPARPRLATRRAGILATVLLGGCLAATANAGSVRSGGCTIHYNALSGDALPLVSTRAYGLRHTSDQGIVVISARCRHGTGSINVPVAASGHATTLLGRKVKLNFRRVGKRDGYSTLATFGVSNGETLRFDIDVTPRDAPVRHLRFMHEYVP